MNSAADRHLVRALKKPANERNSKDIDAIVQFLHATNDTSGLLVGLSIEETRVLASQARYEWRDADEVLFTSEDDVDSSCFVLLSGLVYVDNRLAYPGALIRSKETHLSRSGRLAESIVLEPSEFLAVDVTRRLQMHGQRRRVPSSGYGGGQVEAPRHHLTLQSYDHILSDPYLEESSVDVDSPTQTTPISGHEVSAYVAASTKMPSSQSRRPFSDDGSSVSSFASSNAQGGLRRTSTQQGSSLTVDDIDLTGLTESAVDSDDDLLSPAEETSTSDLSDVYRECLEKNPGQRTDRDIDLLVDFVQNFPAFANLTQNAKRSLCQVMTYAVVEEAGAVILSDGDEVDSWSVVINGTLEHRLPDGSVRELGVGESFGVESARDNPRRRHSGVLRTLSAYCQFIVVNHNDYVSVLSRAEQDKQVVRDKGHVVLVMEERDFITQPGVGSLPQIQFTTPPRTGVPEPSVVRTRRVPVVIRGTVERLIELVVPPTFPNTGQVDSSSSQSDPTFAEDFLTTFPLFLDSVLPVCSYLLEALRDAASPQRQRKAAHVVTHWISADFGLFERVRELGDFLEHVEDLLEKIGLIPQLKLLLLATHSRSRARPVVITRSAMGTVGPSTTNLDAAGFQVTGGLEQRAGVFVSHVRHGGAAWRAGLRRGDQILHVNNHDFASITHTRALDILLGTSHLALTVKYNKLGLHSLSSVAQSFNLASSRPPRPSLPPLGHNSTHTKSEMKTSATTGNVRSASSVEPKHGTKFSRLVAKVSKKLVGGKAAPSIALVASEKDGSSPATPAGNLTRSRSNPDLVSGMLPKRSAFPDPPDQAVLVYTPEQDHRYFLIRSDTTAADLIGMAVREFGLGSKLEAKTDVLGNFALFEVTVHPTTQSVRTRRLLDDRSDLAERLPVCARYYLRQITSASSQSLVGAQEAAEVIGELAKVNLLGMRPRLVALVLTLAEFDAFEQIQPLDYIDDVLALTDGSNSRSSLLANGGGHARVDAMTVLSNRQLFWVVTEVVGEHKLRRRVQLVQFFIKLAGFCLRLNNFESTFAIVAGLGHSAVVRLNATWTRVAPKYKKLLEDYRELFDPSRNMSRYRNHIAKLQRDGRLCPAVPLFPLVKKDLAFVHLGNSTFVSENDADPGQKANLVNVEKLRMLGREVRQIRQLCAERYPGKELFDQVYFNSGPDAGHKGVVSGLSAGWLTLGRRKAGHNVTLGRIAGSDSPGGPKQIFSALRTRKQIEFYLNSRLHFPPGRSVGGEAIPVTDDSAKVCADERQLMATSHKCEPDSVSSVPSSASKQANYTPPLPPPGPVAPKFGTVEGQNISKMMSLCKEVKPHSEKSKPLPAGLVVQSPAPATAPLTMRSPTGQRIPRNLIYQYVLQQQMTDIQAELRRRPIARLSSESSSVVPASFRLSGVVSATAGHQSRSHSSTSSGFGHF